LSAGHKTTSVQSTRRSFYHNEEKQTERFKNFKNKNNAAPVVITSNQIREIGQSRDPAKPGHGLFDDYTKETVTFDSTTVTVA
jgi:hypothetical protein